jgi:hypothetical protein
MVVTHLPRKSIESIIAMSQTQESFGLLTLAYLAVLTATSSAAVTYSEEKDDQGFSETTVIRMTVTPAAEPVPAFKYRLEARDIDLQPGNAAPYYYRAMSDVDRLRESRRKEFGDVFDDWCETGTDKTPLDELPLDKVRQAELRSDGTIMEQLRIASTRRDCDWQLGVSEIRGIELTEFVIDEVQESRSLSRLLSLRSRLAIAERRYDDAIDAMRMNYRLAVNTARVPFLVSGLVGIADASITNGTLIELIAAPDSPNMYWALAELPQPLIDMRSAARFEMEFGERMFPFIHNAESTDRSPQEWDRLYTQAVRDLAAMGGGDDLFAMAERDENAGLVALAAALAGYSHAKAALIADGLERDRVEQMAVGQVMAIYTDRIYQRYANDMERIWYVPFSEMRKYDHDVESRLRKVGLFSGHADREVLPIVSLLLPAVQAARAAQFRLQRDLATLQVIEAIRIHAAANDGRLPATLDDVTQVPIPLNPATGKPFVYRLEGKMAILELPESDGTPDYQRRYEIQIATNKE